MATNRNVYSLDVNQLGDSIEAAIKAAKNQPVQICSAKQPIAYLISAQAWEAISEKLDQLSLLENSMTRLHDGKSPLKINLNDL